MIIAFFYSSHIAFLYLGLATLVLGLIHVLTRLQVQLIVPYWLLGGLLWLCLFKAGVHPTLSGILLAFVLPVPNHAKAPAEQFKQSLHPWVPMLILPLFAFANAGVPLHDVHTMPFPFALFFGCMLGLVLGKPIGVVVFSWLAVRLRIGSLPAAVQWHEFIGMACLCGIGFTISLFIANLAFDSSQADLNAAKLGTLIGSLLSGVLGYCWLRRQPRPISA